MKVCHIALSLFTAAAVWAQPPQGPTPRGRFGPGGPGNLENRLTQHLGLNPTQQNTLHTALEEERTQTKGMGEQMHTLHQTLAAAVIAGNSEQIDSVTQQISSLEQQRSAIHAKQMTKVYSALSAEQKTKVGPNLEMLLGPGMPEGPRGRGPRPGGPKPAAPPNQ
jgi:Spy/CpxP family protein refolding chaperone